MPLLRPNTNAEIVIVTGSREWTSESTIKYWLLQFKNIKLVIHGSARGADLLAEKVCKQLQIPYLGVPAKWHKYKKSAGPIRNKAECVWVELINNNIAYGGYNFEGVQVLAFHLNINLSKGTKDMITQCKNNCYPVSIVDKYID